MWVYQLITIPLLIWIWRGFFEDVSPDIEAADQLDGYSWWRVFLQVLLPLVKPGLVAAGLLCFIFAWNAFTFPLLLANNFQTSRVIALRYLLSERFHFGQLAAAAAISALPGGILRLLIQNTSYRGLR